MTELAARPASTAVPSGGHELRAVVVVWRRELIRFLRNRIRIVTSLVQPALFLFVLGAGLSPAMATDGGPDYQTFVFPGILMMTVLFAAVFSAISIVWDREFGFLREMLVAPVSRWSIVLGKCLGGATVSTLQGMIVLLLAGFVGVPYAPSLLAELVGIMALSAFALTALGVLVAARIRQMESFQAIMQFLVMPMFFLSGALFPLGGLPGWLAGLTIVNPLTYAVDPMRRAVFSHLGGTVEGVAWGSVELGTPAELGLLLAFGLVCLAGAMREFSRTE